MDMLSYSDVQLSQEHWNVGKAYKATVNYFLHPRYNSKIHHTFQIIKNDRYSNFNCCLGTRVT